MALQRIVRLARYAAALALVAAACTAWGAGELHSLWAVKGTRNTVYLLGSVHLLRSADRVLPEPVLRAYGSAKAVVMEMDPTDLANIATALVTAAALPQGQTLSSVLGPELHARFADRARALGVDPDFLNRFQPWFAMVLLEQMKLARLGYDPDIGVDRQLAQRALGDGKRIIGLETTEEQIGVLADMSPQEQRSWVADSLQQLDDSARVLDVMVDAWRKGDMEAVERSGREAFKDAPGAYRRMVVDRNRRWVAKIGRLLDEPDDYLVVVGVLHLAGRDSIIDLLQKQGYTAVQQ